MLSSVQYPAARIPLLTHKRMIHDGKHRASLHQQLLLNHTTGHPRLRQQPHATEHEQQQVQDAGQRHQDGNNSTSSASSNTSNGAGSSRLVLFGGLVATAVLILVAVGGFGGLKEKVNDLEAFIAASGDLGLLVYAGAYAVSTVLLFPASLLTLAAGYLFGPLKGTALVSASATGGACLAFLVSRYLARPLVESKVADNPKFKAVYNNITADGAKLVLLLRLSPLVPFSLLNYGLGITQIRFLDFAGASWLGMLPGTFAYVYLGSLGKVAADAAAEGTSGSGSFDTIKVALYVIGGVATIWATKLISQAASKAISEDQAGVQGNNGAE